MNKLIFLFFVFFINISVSQSLKGKVYAENKTISNAFVILNSEKLQYSKTDKSGYFEFKNLEIDANVSLEINALGYETYIANFIFKKDTTLTVFLEKAAIVLKEVTVIKEFGFISKNDTTRYNIEKYKDGSEKVVEDLLKKLPGIAVDKSGRISFKGKEIESLMFDGDDLFDVNYRIGSKNINVDLIEGIEAIENFNNNQVLKNVTNSNKVALNLKIKKSAANYSLNSNLNSDFNNNYKVVNNGILMSKKLKVYNLLSFNNVGLDNSPFFIFAKNSLNETSSIQNIKSRNVISEGGVPLTLGNENAMLNKNVNFSNTFLTRFNKNAKNTVAIGYFEDKITQNYQTNSSFSNGINTNYLQDITLKPVIYHIFNKYDYNTSKLFIENKTLVEINTNKFINNINNNGLLNRSNLNTDKLFLANKTEISTALNKKSALNSIFFLSNFRNNQNLKFETPIDFIDGFQIQKQLFDLNTITINSSNEYYYSKDKFKIKFSNNLFINEDKMFSNTNIASDLLTNDLRFSTFKNDINFELIYKIKKFSFRFNPIYNYTNLQLNEKHFDAENLLFNYSLRYIISKKADLSVNYRQDVKAPDVNFLYTNFIVQDFRSFTSNNENLKLLKSNDLSLTVRYMDYLNSFQSQFGFSYQNKTNDFQNFNAINQNFIVNRNVILDFDNQVFNAFFSAHKYIGFLKSNVKFNTNFNVLKSSVFISNELIPFKNYQTNFSLDIATAFKNKLNFSNLTNFTTNEQVLSLANRKAFLKQINNEFKMVYLINNNSNFNITYNYFKPNFDRKEDYNFLNFYFEKKIYNEKINLSLTGHNLLNVKSFESSSIFSQGFSNFSYSLISRYLLLGVNFKLI